MKNKGNFKGRPILVQPEDLSIKLIALTRDQVTVVDAEIYGHLMQWTWYAMKTCSGFYAVRTHREPGAKRASVLMHNEIAGRIEGMRVDHKNHDTLDNRGENLRHCTPSQNLFNSPNFQHNTSGVRGVYFDKSMNLWVARIQVYGKHRLLGAYPTLEEATEAVRKGSLEIAGEFSWIHNEREEHDICTYAAAT